MQNQVYKPYPVVFYKIALWRSGVQLPYRPYKIPKDS